MHTSSPLGAGATVAATVEVVMVAVVKAVKVAVVALVEAKAA